ncbi:MAG TPA: HAMP domain-containing sensor histidine kinase [Gemmatimonadaceae bacterium]|nr:HAMP domain-containing sensor histidine kinase [Gemmatimonadaceae bacterium]
MSGTTWSLSTLSDTPLHDLGDVLEVGILTVDASLVIRGWNRWLEVASGRAAAHVIGRSLFEIFPELRGSPAEVAFRNALAGTSVILSHRFHQHLLPLPAPPGFHEFARMQQSARLVPLLHEDGQADGALALIQDVTERVAREEELRRAMQHAEEASRAKSEFLTMMSHDLKTPLAAIIGYANLINGEMVGPVTDLQRRHLERVKASAEHLISMIEEVLLLATVDAGKAVLNLSEFDVARLTRETAEMLERQATEKGLTLTVNVPTAPVLMRSDTTKLRQILVNLLGNAVKFTEQGSISLEMRLEARRVSIRVRDTGRGMGPEDLERIFEPFTRVRQPNAPATSGTGLGLSVSRRLARLLGGDLAVESQRDEGSVFTLWLPLESAPATKTAERAASPQPSAAM